MLRHIRIKFFINSALVLCQRKMLRNCPPGEEHPAPGEEHPAPGEEHPAPLGCPLEDEEEGGVVSVLAAGGGVVIFSSSSLCWQSMRKTSSRLGRPYLAIRLSGASSASSLPDLIMPTMFACLASSI